MHYRMLDTRALYARLLAEPEQRAALLQHEVAAPYAPLLQIFGGGADDLALLAQWGITADVEPLAGVIDALAAANAWELAEDALAAGLAAFAPHADRIPLDEIIFGLFAVNPALMAAQRGYSGFGGIPGSIIVTYGEVNAYTLSRLQGATAHELLHNIHFSIMPFNPMLATVGEYIVAEGLAESFAAALFGEAVVGYYVTDFDPAQMNSAREIIGAALDKSGFNVIRGYVFGDTLAESMGFEKAGVPDYAGYAIGYHVVQAYLKRTGQTVPEAVFVPARQIIAESGWFG